MTIHLAREPSWVLGTTMGLIKTPLGSHVPSCYIHYPRNKVHHLEWIDSDVAWYITIVRLAIEKPVCLCEIIFICLLEQHGKLRHGLGCHWVSCVMDLDGIGFHVFLLSLMNKSIIYFSELPYNSITTCKQLH